MNEYTIWNLVNCPRLKIRDKYISSKVKSLLQDFILPDETVHRIKSIFENEITSGLLKQTPSSSMNVTFLTDRFTSADGEFISICAHSHYLAVTLVHFETDSLPIVHKKSYSVNIGEIKESKFKIFEKIAKCVKNLYYEFDLSGKIIPTAFCTDLSLVQFSLDTAVIPDFEDQVHKIPYPKDIKSIFEEILHKDEYQAASNCFETDSLESQTSEGEKENKISEISIDMKLLGVENVLALDFSQDLCQKILKQMQALYDSGQNPQDIVYHVNHSGIKVEDPDKNIILFRHTLHKMSYITQDPHQAMVFGYIFGDFVHGHKFIAFQTEYRSIVVIQFLKDILQRELMKKKKEEFDIKASQIYLSLKDFDRVAQIMVVREKDIPSVLSERVALVENISWWLEGCTESVEPTHFVPEDIPIKVKIQDLFRKAVEPKLIEIEKEEEEKSKEAKSKKMGTQRKKTQETTVNITTKNNRPPTDPHLDESSEIIKKKEKLFQIDLERKKQKLEFLELRFKKLLSKSTEKLSSKSLEWENKMVKQLCEELKKELSEDIGMREKEICDLKEQFDSLSSLQNSKMKKIQLQDTQDQDVNIGPKQYLRTIETEWNSIYTIQDFILNSRKIDGQPLSEVRKRISKCQKLLLAALKLRKEEIDDLNWYINELHCKSHQKLSKESRIVSMARALFVKLTKMRLYEILNLKSALDILNHIDKELPLAIPNTCKNCKSLIETIYEKKEKIMSQVHVLLVRFPDLSEVEALDSCKEICIEFKNLIISEIQQLEDAILKFKNFYTELNIAPSIHNLFKDIISKRRQEIDTLVENFDKIKEIFVDDLNSEDVEIKDICKDICLTGIVMREKEINAYELELQSDMEESIPKIIRLKDIFYAALELERSQYELLVTSETGSEIFPVEFILKDLYCNVSSKIRQQRQGGLVDQKNSVKELQVFTSLEEFISMAFQQRQIEIEVPISKLKAEFEKVLCCLIDQVKSRESELISDTEHHIQALQISNAWKEVFLIMAELRKSELENVMSVVAKEEQDKKAAFQYDTFKHLDYQGKQVLESWKTILKSAVNMKQKEISKISSFIKDCEKNGPEEINEDDDFTSIEDENAGIEAGDSQERTSHSEILKIIFTCKQIYTLVQNKSKAELEVLEREMRPIFNPEYDEEITETHSDEITLILDDLKRNLLEFYENLREQDSKTTNTMDALNEINDNIKTMASTVKESSKYFLNDLLQTQEADLVFIEKNLEIVENNIIKLSTESDDAILPFTDLLVDVLSAEDISIENLDEQLGDEQEVEVDKPPRFSRDEIEAFLLEIDREQKVKCTSEVEDVHKIGTVKVLSSCQDFFKSAAEIRNKMIISAKEILEDLEKPDKKKMKPKQKLEKMQEFITSCQNVFVLISDNLKSEMKYILSEIDCIYNISQKEDRSEEIKPSDVAMVSRKLFSSFIEARGKSLSLIEIQLNLLEEKEKTFSTDVELKPEILETIKTEVFTECKDLVIGSVDQKMREVDELSSQLQSLNSLEEKLDAQIEQMVSKESTAAKAKLEKVKDAVSSCKKLGLFALETAKHGMKDADEELSMIKGIMETAKTSLLISTCVNILNTSLEEKSFEISDIQQILDAVKSDAEKTSDWIEENKDETVELQTSEKSLTDMPPDLNIQDIEIKDPGAVEVQKSLKNVLEDSSPMEGGSEDTSPMEEGSEDTSLMEGSLEDTSKNPLEEAFENDRKIFFEEILLHISECMETRILKCQEQIESIDANVNKIKVTVSKVENEDSKVFDICNASVLSCTQMRKDEIKLLESEYKCLKNTNLEEMTASNAESEVDVSASCKKALKLIIKNRKQEKDAIHFELMDLIRYQDARLSTVCRNILLTTLEKSNSEKDFIENILKQFELIDDQYELLDSCIKISLELIDLLGAQIISSGASLQVLSEAKMNSDIEDSYFINDCYEMLLSQIAERKIEISLLKHEMDSVTSLKLEDDSIPLEVENLIKLLIILLLKSIDNRKGEMKKSESAVIKKLNLKVFDVNKLCKEDFLKTLQIRKDYLIKYSNLLEGVYQVNSDEKTPRIKARSVSENFLNLLPFAIERAEQEMKISENNLNILLGKQTMKDVEDISSDAVIVASQGGPKLNIEGSEILSTCKNILYRIIKDFEGNIKEMSVALEELKETCKPLSSKMQKPLSETLPENHNYTPRQLALLEELELEMENSDNYKENVRFCEQLYLSFIDRKGNEINEFKNLLIKLNSISENLMSEASILLYAWRDLCRSEMEMNKFYVNFDIDEFIPLLLIEKWTHNELNMVKVENSIRLVKDKEEKDLAHLMIMFHSIELKNEVLTQKILQTNESCSGPLQEAITILKTELNLCEDGYEKLKMFIDEISETDATHWSSDEKVVKRCELILLNSIESKRNALHVMTLELDFLLPNSGHADFQKSEFLPTWCERFIQSLGLNTSLEGVKSSTVFTTSLSPKTLFQNTISDNAKSSRYILYKDLLKAMKQKRLILPASVVSTWSDFIIHAFLLEQIEIADLEKNKEMTESIFRIDYTWDELLLKISELVGKAEQTSSLQKSEKMMFISVSTWLDIFRNAITDWQKQMNKDLKSKVNETTLLQWKTRLEPEEYCELVASYFYEDDSKIKELTGEISTVELKIKDFSLDLGLFFSNSSEHQVEEENNLGEKSMDLTLWEDIFLEAGQILADNGVILSDLKKQELKVQYKTFFKAAEDFKSDLELSLKERILLNQVSKSVREAIEVKQSEPLPQPKVFSNKASKSTVPWVEKIYEAYQSHIRNLKEAVAIKNTEFRNPEPRHDLVHCKTEENPYIDIEVTDVLSLGRRLFSRALELQKCEMKTLTNQPNSFKAVDKFHDTKNEGETHNLHWKNIVTALLHFRDTGRVLEDKRKIKERPSKEFFDVVEVIRAIEMDLEKTTTKTHDPCLFQWDTKTGVSSWDDLLQKIFEVTSKDMAEAKELDSSLSDSFIMGSVSSDTLDMNIPWVDMFIEGVRQKVKELNPDEIDFQLMFAQQLSSETIASWNEIFYILSNYDKKFIQEKLKDENSQVLVPQSNLDSMKKLVNKGLGWDEIFIAAIEEYLRLLAGQNKSELKMSWIDVLPSSFGAKRSQVEKDLLIAKIKLLHPNKSFVKEKLPDELIWKHLFPVAVLEWKQIMKNYLNIIDYSTHDEDIHNIEANEESTEFDLPSISSHDSIEPSKMDLIECVLLNDSLEPKYFSITASWREIFFAAIERKRKILSKLIEFKNSFKKFGKEAEEKDKDIHPQSENNSPNIRQKSTCISASDVLECFISLRDLFEVVKHLQQKKLVVCKEKSEVVKKFKNISTENIKASDVVDIFKDFLLKVMFNRKKETTFLKKELFTLQTFFESHKEEPQASILLHTMEKFYHDSISIRDKENSLINQELELLKEFKDIFVEYLECGVELSVQQRNLKKILTLKQELKNIEGLQTEFNHKLSIHLSQCKTKYEKSLVKRKDEIFSVDIAEVNSLFSDLNEENQELMSSAKTLLVYLSDVRTKEINFIESEINVLKSIESKYGLESKVQKTYFAAINFLSECLQERNKLEAIISESINLIKKANEEIVVKMHKTFATCRHLFYEAINKRQREIKTLEKDWITIKSKIPKTKTQEAEILHRCEGYVKKACDKRKQEVLGIESYLKDMSTTQVQNFLASCLKYFSETIDKRRQEVIEIEKLLEPLTQCDKDKEKEFSLAIEEAMCDAFGIQSGMLFYKIEEKTQDIDITINPEFISLFTDFYGNSLEHLQKEIKYTEENYVVLQSFVGEVTEKIIEVMNQLVLILGKENALVRNEISIITMDLNAFRDSHDKCLSDAKKIFSNVKESMTNHQKDNKLDISDLEVQLKILSKGDVQEDFEHYINKKMDELESTSIDESTTVSELDSEKDSQSRYDTLVSNILKSAVDWRQASLKSLKYKVDKLITPEGKSLELISLLANGMEDIFLEGEKRKSEIDKVESLIKILHPLNAKNFPKECLESLLNLQQSNYESKLFIDSQLDRLTKAFEVLQEESASMCAVSSEDTAIFIPYCESVVKNLTSELAYLSCLGSEDAIILTNLKNIFRNAVEERAREMATLNSYINVWTAETEMHLIVKTSLNHFQACFEKRNLELLKVNEFREVLEIEGDMNSLLYSPALEALKTVNGNEIEWFSSKIYTFSLLCKELEIQGGKILEGCQKIYCSLLETLKIEIKAIEYDIKNIQNIKSDVGIFEDPEDKELEIDFKDLFMESFHIKKNELLSEFNRKIIDEDVLKKKQDVFSIVVNNKKPPTIENIENATLNELIGYFQSKKETRKHEMKDSVKQFNTLESLFTLEKIDIKAISALEREISYESIDEEEATTSQDILRRVFEVKVQKIQEDMDFRKEKISTIIKQRRELMNNLIKSKKNELMENVLAKEKQIKHHLNDIKDEESQIVCCLTDILNDIVQLKSYEKSTLKNQKELEKFLDEDLRAKCVLVKIENLFAVALSIKEEEFEIIKQSKLKDIKKCYLVMKKEVVKRELDSYKSLDEALEKYFKAQKIKAHIQVGLSTLQDYLDFQDYTICDEDIFQDLRSFEKFLSDIKLPYNLKEKKSVNTKLDTVFRAFETCHLSFMQPYAYALQGFVGQLLNTYEAEVMSLSNAISSIDSNGSSSNASCSDDDIISRNTSLRDNLQKAVHFDINAVVNKNTSLLMLGSYFKADCDIAINLGRDFGLVYFADVNSVSKWQSPVQNVTEVSVDIGLKGFGNDGSIDFFETKFDKDIATVPLTLSKFEKYIADTGLLELIRSVFMELHHQHLLCRNCELGNVFKNSGLSFYDINNFLSSESESEMLQSIPIASGVPTLDDVAVANYASKVVLIRGALLTSICLCEVLNQLNRKNVKILASSRFIEKYPEYQEYLKVFLSKFSPNQTVEFFSCDNASCSFGASLIASVADRRNRENPEYYLLELRKGLDEGNTYFSVNKFLNIVENPDFFQEAFSLAEKFYKHLNFDVPLSVIWAYYFMNEKFQEAGKLYQKYPVCLKHVNSIICQKIRLTENFKMWKIYKDFIKKQNVGKKLIIKVYRCIFDLLVVRNMNLEAVTAVQELVEMGIPLSNLQLPALRVLYNFCSKPSSRAENIPMFFIPVKETYFEGNLDSE